MGCSVSENTLKLYFNCMFYKLFLFKNNHFISVFFLCSISTAYTKPIIINALDGGRLGDKLLTYTRALWVAWQNNLDLELRYFPYMEHLKLDLAHKKYHRESKESVINLRRQKNIDFDSAMAYAVGYYFSDSTWGSLLDITTWYGLIDNSAFIKILKEHIVPCQPYIYAPLPSNRLSVAIHIRRGGGYDAPLLAHKVEVVDYACMHTPLCVRSDNRNMLVKREFTHRSKRRARTRYADVADPLKFPPLDFYVHALRLIVSECNSAPLYVYIFTDDKNPVQLKTYFEELFQVYDIQFDCRIEDNGHDKHVIADMFDMARYQYLIRPDSSYSKVAQLIGDHTMIVYPDHAAWSGYTFMINQIIMAKNKTEMTYVNV